ncbi:hypothetical protein ZHAS_00002786 [Anopheles sinensis]|uniref:Uncharacterized protein n=1 Tax=Anopheles sinensis TaxID=74873 RepID=A0A084VD02_ANOSI|nr:hypothetical protein ZHAS_00002786 [Anopheles sinensis]
MVGKDERKIIPNCPHRRQSRSPRRCSLYPIGSSAANAGTVIHNPAQAKPSADGMDDADGGVGGYGHAARVLDAGKQPPVLWKIRAPATTTKGTTRRLRASFSSPARSDSVEEKQISRLRSNRNSANLFKQHGGTSSTVDVVSVSIRVTFLSSMLLLAVDNLFYRRL